MLHYQPIMDLRTGRVIGFEALMRWNHPERGLLRPSQFIAFAEETGLIVPMGMWALETACRQTAYWQSVRDRTTDEPPLAISVNLAARQVADRTLAKTVAEIIDRTGISPGAVCLELTENTLMQDTASTVDALHALRSQGVHLSIDDFGTGYSSLSYLKRFPVESLKIDRSFIDGLGRRVGGHEHRRGDHPPGARARALRGRRRARDADPARDAAHARLRLRAGLPARPAPCPQR